MLTVVAMYMMARHVWQWGKRFNVMTQTDLFGMRYGSKTVRVVAALIAVVSTFPWLVLGMQALGLVCYFLGFGSLTFREGLLIAIGLLVVRQIWTISMGMRGIVITDTVQGVAAYVGGTVLGDISSDLAWWARHTLASVPRTMFVIPGLGSSVGALYISSLIVTGILRGWCWPGVFVRLFTANGVRSIKTSAALSIPLSLVFGGVVFVVAITAGTVHGVAANPDNVYFVVTGLIHSP